MENLNFKTEDEKTIRKKEHSLFLAIAATAVAVIVLAIIGFISIKPAQQIVQGQVDGTNVRVSGLMPGRVEKFYVHEGQIVHKGDTLAKIESATVDAKLAQALAMRDAAEAQKEKADAGARKQVIASAYELWQQARASLDIHKRLTNALNRSTSRTLCRHRSATRQRLPTTLQSPRKAQPSRSMTLPAKALRKKTRWQRRLWQTQPEDQSPKLSQF